MKFVYPTIGIIATLLGFLISGDRAYAHGFGERYDLPIPLNYFLIGGAFTVVLSFVLIGWFVRQKSERSNYVRINLWQFWAFRLISKVVVFSLAMMSIMLLALCVISGLLGTPSALDNFVPTFVWIIWWVGVGYVVALIGNVWAISNPWQVAFKLYEKLAQRGKMKSGGIFQWPNKLDAWPALLGFVVFAWIENVYTGASRPFTLSSLIILYTGYTWVGMFLFGRHIWLKNADPFSVLFSLFSRFSPTEIRIGNSEERSGVCLECNSGCREEMSTYVSAVGEAAPEENGIVDNVSGITAITSPCVDCYECWEISGRDRQWKKLRSFSIRPWGSGLLRGDQVSTSLVIFYITVLATVTYDGLSETPVWVSIQTFLWPLVDPFPGSAISGIESIGVLIIPLIFAGIYVLICRYVSSLSGNSMEVDDVIHSFVFSLVPIAIVYNLSHYFSFLMITGQQIIPLVSNPFGCGIDEWAGSVCSNSIFSGLQWNLFNTANYKPNIAIVDARFAWILSVTAIVAGHIASVFVAHVISLKRMTDYKLAVRSQYPMLALMVFYTAVGLWIISKPLVD
jgi:hypothetical protein